MTPTHAEEHVSSYDVLVDGQDIDQSQKDRIKEIRVVDYLRLPDICTLQLTYPRAEGVDDQPFQIGKALEVRLGARDELAPQSLFKGQVVSLDVEFGAGGCSVLVRAYDRSHLLHRSRRVRTFQNQTDSDIVEKVVRESGLTPQCDASGEPHEFMQQDNETDWDFIWRLAERIGFEFVVEDGTAYFRRPSPEGAVELQWPDSLRSFRPRVTSVQQVKKVTLRAQDQQTKKAIDVSASTPVQIARIGLDRESVAGAFEDSELHVATEPVKSDGEARALTQALLDKLANGYIAAEGVAPGNPAIKAGAKVKVGGVGQSFSGTYRVATSMHLLRGGGAYETHFANSPSHTVLGAVGADNGSAPRFGTQLVVGVVTNNDDPANMGRVRVRYPALGDDAEGAWAHVATPSAGNARGVLMLPVPGEEVLVAFEHGDTTHPYVIGSLFNGVDLPGDDLLQGKDGSFALRSDHKIYTEAQEDFTIKTGTKLAITTGANLEESVGGDWNHQTSGKASLQATQPFQIQGQNVQITADSQVTIQGNATLTLTCGASQIQLSASGVTVSGPMISLG